MARNGWVVLGMVLVVLGIAGIFLEGVSYVTREEVLDVGPIQVTADREERIGIPPWVSLVLIGGGAVSLAVGLSGRQEV